MRFYLPLRLLYGEGKVRLAEIRLRRRIREGDIGASMMLASRLHRHGRRDDAAVLYQRAADAGLAIALNDLAVLRVEQGHRRDGEKLYREAIDAGVLIAVHNLAELLEHDGRRAEAEAYYRRAAD